MLRQLTLFGLVLFLAACQKKTPFSNKNEDTCKFKNQECDSALFTLINRTEETIYYGIGTNMWEDSLLPGQQRSVKYGHVKVTYDNNCTPERESWGTHQLSSSWGEWAYHIDHCDKKSAFEYTDTSKSVIYLYDVTEY